MSDIIKTQQGLARKAEAQRAHRFEDLYHVICKREWIEEALRHVLDNDGSQTAGVDGMSWKAFNDVEKSDFENDEFRQQFIDELQQELKTQTFKPLPVRRVEISKPGTNKKRPLGIPTIKDRTVQTLLKMLMEPIWEADFYHFSNGFRPGRCTMDCIQPLYTLFNTTTGYRWVIEGDIRACFDRIPHIKLLAAVARRIGDRKVLALIRRFLKSGIMDCGKLAPSDEGTPQGGICSPLLANIYLHQFDEWFDRTFARPDKATNRSRFEAWYKERKKGGPKAAAQMYRYADDWIVLVRGTREQAQTIKEQCKTYLQEVLGLELSEEKTMITHIKDGFNFLGYHIFRCDQPSNRRIVGVFVQPTEKGLKGIKQKIKEMTTRKTLRDDYVHKIRAINAAIRGWANYYRAVNPTAAFQELDQYVWLRLRKWLEKKYQLSPSQVRRQYMHRQKGPKGGTTEFAAQEADGTWVWRYRTVQTKLIYYRPTYKKSWPNPYLEKVKCEPYILPTLKVIWGGYHEAPTFVANRRKALRRAKGACERCGTTKKLAVHHTHRVNRGKRKVEQADNRPEMLEVLCRACHDAEHRAENMYRKKQAAQKRQANEVKSKGEPVAGATCTAGSVGRMQKRLSRKG
jgi:RNA-directed DNA polymerase